MKYSPLSLRILKVILALWWWATVALSAGAAVLLVVRSVTSPERIRIDFVGLASDVDTSALSASTHAGVPGRVEFDEPVKIKVVVPANPQQSRIALVVGLVVFLGAILALFLYFLRQFREIVDTLELGDPFVPENARRVRIIGILIMLAGFVRTLVVFISGAIADSTFVTAGFDFSARVSLDFSSLVAGLSVIALSEVFRHGTKLREEQALTV